MSIYESLEVVITLRCNAACRNCIRGCNAERTTGLDLHDLDMTLDDVRRVCADLHDVHAATGERVVDTLCVTGGEPTLHDDLVGVWRTIAALVPPYVAGEIVCNVNRTRPVPAEIEPHVVHWWSVAEKPTLHQCAYISPTAPPFGFPTQPAPTWATCTHYRRRRLIVTLHGYQVCCAAEGYTRLMARSELMMARLPTSIDDFPRPDVVCAHCAFGAPRAFAERGHGRPVSPIFDEEARLNHHARLAGRSRMPLKLREERSD